MSAATRVTADVALTAVLDTEAESAALAERVAQARDEAHAATAAAKRAMRAVEETERAAMAGAATGQLVQLATSSGAAGDGCDPAEYGAARGMERRKSFGRPRGNTTARAGLSA